MKKKSILGAIFALMLVAVVMIIFATSSEDEGQHASPETIEVVNGRFSIMNDASFEEWIEEDYARQVDRGVMSREEIDSRRVAHEHILEILNHGGADMIIVDDRFEVADVFWFSNFELVSLESFKVQKDQLVLQAEESNRVTSWELVRMRENLDRIQNLMNDDMEVLLNMETGRLILLLENENVFEINPAQEIDFENFTRNQTILTFSLNLNDSEFEQWAEERLTQMATSGEYSERDINILRDRYDRILELVKVDESIRVRINAENEVVSVTIIEDNEIIGL